MIIFIKEQISCFINAIIGWFYTSPKRQTNILFVTTHGEYDSVDTVFDSPMDFTQISAVKLGVHNYLCKEYADHFAHTILEVMRNEEIQYVKSGAEKIRNILIKLDEDTHRQVSNKDDLDFTIYKRSLKEAYKIKNDSVGDSILDKEFFTNAGTYCDSPFFNTIVLLNKTGFNDIIREIRGRTNYKDQSVLLSEVLDHLKSQHHIENLILIDLSCNTVANSSERSVRYVLRSEHKYKR